MASLDTEHGFKSLWRLRRAAPRDRTGLAEMTDEVQRSLGRIEGTQKEILRSLTELGNKFAEHVQQDQISFSSVRALVFEQKQDLKKQFEDAGEARNKHLNEQDVKLDALMTARAVLTGQMTLGQKILAGTGAAVLLLWEGFQAYMKYRH